MNDSGGQTAGGSQAGGGESGSGGNPGIKLYALSTCVWCGKTKTLLKDLGVDFDSVDVDLLSGAERDLIMDEIKRWNPDNTFPTLVINGQQCIVGFREAEIREALGR